MRLIISCSRVRHAFCTSEQMHRDEDIWCGACTMERIRVMCGPGQQMHMSDMFYFFYIFNAIFWVQFVVNNGSL